MPLNLESWVQLSTNSFVCPWKSHVPSLHFSSVSVKKEAWIKGSLDQMVSKGFLGAGNMFCDLSLLHLTSKTGSYSMLCLTKVGPH